jgi:hypothetical protein
MLSSPTSSPSSFGESQCGNLTAICYPGNFCYTDASHDYTVSLFNEKKIKI